MTTSGTKPVTADELLAMQRGYGFRYELVRGVVFPSPASVEPVAAAIGYAAFSIAKYAETNDFGSVAICSGYRLETDPDTVRAPDVGWIAPGRIPEGTEGYPELAPDLAVEV